MVAGFGELDPCLKSKVTLTQPQLSHIETLNQSLYIFFLTKIFLIYFPIRLQVKASTLQIHTSKLNWLVRTFLLYQIKNRFLQKKRAVQGEAALYRHVSAPTLIPYSVGLCVAKPCYRKPHSGLGESVWQLEGVEEWLADSPCFHPY